MWLKIALIISVLLQFATAIIAISFIKRSKINIAWWLISIGFLLMAIRRLVEFIQLIDKDIITNDLINSWLGVLISVIMLVSLAFIKRIFNIQERLERIKNDSQARVFSAIIHTEEKQKHKFAKELHDGLGPLLSSIKMAISAVIQKNDTNETKSILQNTEKLIDVSIKTVKEISNSLSPHVLINFGLLKAIKSFINRMPEINVEFHIQSNINEKRYSPTHEAVCYRVICELINNSLRHSEATDIYITINETNKSLHLNYSDNGIGTKLTDETIINKGFGLTNIQSRIQSVNGKCNFHSEPDKGFIADIIIQIQ